VRSVFHEDLRVVCVLGAIEQGRSRQHGALEHGFIDRQAMSLGKPAVSLRAKRRTRIDQREIDVEEDSEGEPAGRGGQLGNWVIQDRALRALRRAVPTAVENIANSSFASRCRFDSDVGIDFKSSQTSRAKRIVRSFNRSACSLTPRHISTSDATAIATRLPNYPLPNYPITQLPNYPIPCPS
jgi:hypothetical protein